MCFVRLCVPDVIQCVLARSMTRTNMLNIIHLYASSPRLLCTLAHSFIIMVEQVFINEGTSVSLKQKDAWEREGWKRSKEEHMLRARMRQDQTCRDALWLQGV